MAQRERAALCDSALQAGPEAPTLCEGWDVRDLLAHLLVRERSLLAVGIAVPALSGLTEREMGRVAKREFATLVGQVRGGPPTLSIYGAPRMDRLLNTLEYLVHHEDIRRAQPGWTARTLPDADEKLVWAMARSAGKRLARSAPVAVRIENVVTGSSVRLSDGEGEVTVRGRPSEVTLFLFGRKTHADVELLGADADVARLSGTALGF
ncbi:MAG: TIGR03085 family protein [Nocardioidaceae bacterium]|nr:TIGR03085 family protein [Nocardioidaceae bacterium]NUS52339.1 TIGR03085 family protein [Nocardioidaceae bacterium]